MAQSMTGYGRAEKEKDGRRVSVEARSVNHRFLEISVKAPNKGFMMDELVRKAVKSRFNRGYFDITVNVASTSGGACSVVVNEDMFREYLAAARKLSDKFGVDMTFSFGDILQVKDIFTISGGEIIPEEWWPLVDEALVETLSQVERSRVAEGDNTIADVLARFLKIEDTLEIVRQGNEDSVKERFDKLKAKIVKLTDEAGIDDNRIAQEAALLADRNDISEELDRIRSHLGQVLELLKTEKLIGRKLEFFLQEINRETNTIGSKTTSSIITMKVVDVKSELEKIREQAQNLE